MYIVCLRDRIQQRHLVLKNKQRRVTLTPLKGSKVTINGRAVSQTTELQHLVGVTTLATDNLVHVILT